MQPGTATVWNRPTPSRTSTRASPRPRASRTRSRCCGASGPTTSGRNWSFPASTAVLPTSTSRRPSSTPWPTSGWRTGSWSMRTRPQRCSGSRWRWRWPSSSCTTIGRLSRSAWWGRSRSCRRGTKQRCGGSRWQRRFACCEPTSWPSSSSSSTAGLCTVRYPGNHTDVDIAYVAPMSSSGPMLREYTITCIASIFPCPTNRTWWAGLYGCRM